MKSVRRPVIALLTTLVLVVIQAVADPTGLLALVGWSGALPQLDALWTWAPYVGLPAGAARRPLVGGGACRRPVLDPRARATSSRCMLAQAAACLVMTWDLATAGWAAGYVTAKAVPAALIVAAFTRWFGGRTERGSTRSRRSCCLRCSSPPSHRCSPACGGRAPSTRPGVPAARPDRGVLSVIVAMVLIAGATVLSLRWMRARVPGVLGGWLAALVAGGAVGIVQAIVALVIDGIHGDIWPLMATYVAVADGLSFGACVGWIVGVSAVLADRIRSARMARTLQLAAGVVAVVAVAVTLITPPSGASAAASDDEPVPAEFLRADGGVIADGDGNQVLLRGVNVNQLVDFYRPRPDVDDTSPLTEEDFAGIAEQGFNVVRLGLSWSALEPERGTLDEAYLDQIRDAVDLAKEHGLYVVLDMHQDSWWNEGTPEGDRVPARHRPDVGLRRRPGVGDHHRRRAALPVPGSRHLAGEQPRLPELLLRHRRRPERVRRDVGQARRRSSPTSRPSPASTC